VDGSIGTHPLIHSSTHPPRMMLTDERKGVNPLTLRAISVPPHDGKPPQGLLVVLHGWGANAQDVAALADYLDLPEFQMIFPDAPFPFPFGPAGRMWYNLPPDYTFSCEPSLAQQPELVESRHLLTEWVRSLPTTTGIPLDKTVLAGFSQGGAMTLDVGLTLPLAGLIVLSGYLHSPIQPLQNPPPVFMVHGRQDLVVPLHAAQDSRDRLQVSGVLLTYQEVEGGHEISLHVMKLMQNFTHQTFQPSGETT